MNRTVENIKHLTQQELLLITNLVVKNKLKSLILSEPISHLRAWDYGKQDEKLECWTIAIDKETDTSIVYSDFGFGPKTPWGLVVTSKLWIGADSGWFDNLVQCYLNSFSASELPIWYVEKETSNGRKTLTSKTKMDSAFNQRDAFAEADKNGRYHVEYSI